MHSIPIQPYYNASYKCEFQSQFISEEKYSLFWLSSFWTKRFSWKFLYIFRIRACNRHILPIATIFVHTRSFSFDQASQSVFFLLFLEMLDGRKKTENEYAEHASSFFPSLHKLNESKLVALYIHPWGRQMKTDNLPRKHSYIFQNEKVYSCWMHLSRDLLPVSMLFFAVYRHKKINLRCFFVYLSCLFGIHYKI